MTLYRELATKKPEELQKLLKKKQLELSELGFKVSSRELKNVREVRDTKKEIARILTALGTKGN